MRRRAPRPAAASAAKAWRAVPSRADTGGAGTRRGIVPATRGLSGVGGVYTCADVSAEPPIIY
jgi:hypothetical protein